MKKKPDGSCFGYPLDGENGTQTDKNGNYSLTVSAQQNLLFLVMSILKLQPVQLANANTINITMSSTDTKLEEVVVVGYGVQQKKAFHRFCFKS